MTQWIARIVLLLFAWAPAAFFRSYLAGKAGYRSVFDLRIDLYYRILRMSASFFTRNRSGGIVSRLISDIELVQNLVGTALTNIWMDFAALLVVPVWRILPRSGIPNWVAFFAVIPLGALILLWVIAFKDDVAPGGKG